MLWWNSGFLSETLSSLLHSQQAMCPESGQNPSSSLSDKTEQETISDPKLPLELLEIVLDHLSPPHTASTFPSRLCLINKAASTKANSLLYKHVVIQDLKALSRFQSTLDRLSCRREAVKHLSLFLPLDLRNRETLDLLQFRNLKSFSLESQSTSQAREDWKLNFTTVRSDPFPRRFPTSLRSLTFGPDAFQWYSSTGKDTLIFKSQPGLLHFEEKTARNSDSYHYKNWTFGNSEDDDPTLKGEGLQIHHLHLYSPRMNSRVFTRLRTSHCFPHLEALTLSLPKVAHPDDLRLLKRTLKHLTDDEEAWVYGTRRTFSRGLRRITVRVWASWVDKVKESLGLEDRGIEAQREKVYDHERLDNEELFQRETELRALASDLRFERAVKVEIFEVDAGKWRSARAEESKGGGWIGDLEWG